METTEDSIMQRCLTLTGCIETSMGAPECYSCCTGNFDGMGMSYGVLQWNIGQGTLQNLFSDMVTAHPELTETVFGSNLPALQAMLLAGRPAQIAWARAGVLESSWKTQFKTLGATPEFQAIQLSHAGAIFEKAKALCARFSLKTERALALMFDVCVQNGSISAEVEALIRLDFAKLPPDDELSKLQSVANRRAEAASPSFIEDVRSRKMTIANGQGTIHGIHYDLEKQFGIRLQPMAA